MKVLGIDPGLAATGWAVVEKDPNNKLKLVDCGCLKTSKNKDFTQRLLQIFNQLKKLIKSHKPQEVAVEEIFFAKNVKTAIKVAQATGVIKVSGQNLGCPVFSYTPLNIKTAVTGYGRADKKQVEFMVTKLLNLKTKIKSNHAVDALAAALTHFTTNRKLKGGQ